VMVNAYATVLPLGRLETGPALCVIVGYSSNIPDSGILVSHRV
jgi:hypothetical protein